MRSHISAFAAQIAEPLPRGVSVLKSRARIGEQMIAFTQTTPNPYLPGSKDNVFFVYWRHGPVTAYVVIVGLKVTVHLSDAIALARKQQGRIVQALR